MEMTPPPRDLGHEIITCTLISGGSRIYFSGGGGAKDMCSLAHHTGADPGFVLRGAQNMFAHNAHHEREVRGPLRQGVQAQGPCKRPWKLSGFWCSHVLSELYLKEFWYKMGCKKKSWSIFFGGRRNSAPPLNPPLSRGFWCSLIVLNWTLTDTKWNFKSRSNFRGRLYINLRPSLNPPLNHPHSKFQGVKLGHVTL